jgi:hypothetical protein
MHVVVRETLSEMTLQTRPVVGPTAAIPTNLLILMLSTRSVYTWLAYC